jgi:hypothetical protein
MRKIIKIYTLFFVLAAFVACSDEKEMQYAVDQDLAPTNVTTGNITGVTYFSAVVEASSASMDEEIIDRGILIADTVNFIGAVAISATVVDSITGSYSTNLADLEEQTQYYIKSYASNLAGGTTYGEVKNFTTAIAPPQWTDLVGTWAVTEDYYSGGVWFDGETYDISISGVPGDKFKIKIDGFAPWQYTSGHTIYATVNNMQITLPSQELLPGWDEPDYRTYFATVKTGTFANDAGSNFPVTDIITNAQGKLQITLRGGLQTYSYFVYDMGTADGSYAGYWSYARNTVWVKQ